MPNQYIRKCNDRGKWSQQDLVEAVEAVRTRNVSVRQASLQYGVPRKTLERRLKTQNFIKGAMGPSSVFGIDHEKRLVRHILKMQEHCFPLTPKDLRSIAYHFAEQLGIKHTFNKDKEEAGYVWLNSFLKRNPEISTRKAEGVSLARCAALSRDEVNAYYDILHNLMEEYELFDKPSHIFNMDESGFQLNNRPGYVLAKKGSKAVSSVTSTEKGETITVIACCNAEGVFLPPACIMKGKNRKQEWKDPMPPGSDLYMSQKSAYINAAIFFEWLKMHFLPRKPDGKVLLCLDGHTSHCNSVEMLEFAATNDIILFTLPSHTTHFLQTLDRSVFRSLKAYYYEACRIWLKRNPGRRLNRLQFGELLSIAWSKAATYENATAGFKATGIYPFNRFAVPDYAFAVTDLETVETNSINLSRNQISHKRNSPSLLSEIYISSSILGDQQNDLNFSGIETSQKNSRTPSLSDMNDIQPGPSFVQSVQNTCTPCLPEQESNQPEPSKFQPKGSPSGAEYVSSLLEQEITATQSKVYATPKKNKDVPLESIAQINSATSAAKEKETPSKFLNDISPIPIKTYQVRKRAKQVATVLTSEKYINYRKDCDEKKNKKLNKCQKNKAQIKIKRESTQQKTKAQKRPKSCDREIEKLPTQKKIKQEKMNRRPCTKKTKTQTQKDTTDSETEDDEKPILLESGDSSPDESFVDDCVGCGDNYYETELTEDWIQCIRCKRWVHENCTEYDDKCHPCGNRLKIDARKGKGKGKRTKIGS